VSAADGCSSEKRAALTAGMRCLVLFSNTKCLDAEVQTDATVRDDTLSIVNLADESLEWYRRCGKMVFANTVGTQTDGLPADGAGCFGYIVSRDVLCFDVSCLEEEADRVQPLLHLRAGGKTRHGVSDRIRAGM